MRTIYEEKPGEENAPEDLYDALRRYAASDTYPFHMPGHKRRLGGMCDPFAIDITEVDGFDDLHHAEGILLQAQERAAGFYGAHETFYLVNGSTAGILAAVSAAAAANGGKRRILMARNSHRSAYHAVYLNRLEPVYLYPEEPGEAEADRYAFRMGVNGRIDPEQVSLMLDRYPDVCAVFVTSPTYDGVVSPVRELAHVSHAHGVPLIVDSAHGAHFGLHPLLPRGAVREGADLVVHSLHKTLPSLTQTALLHVGGDLADPDLVRRFLDIYQTSSPSYVFMAGMDRCIRFMEKEGKAIYEELFNRLNALYKAAESLPGIRLIRTDDPTRILISAGGRLSGREICAILRTDFHIEPEMQAPGYVLCLVGAGDDAAGFERLERALAHISMAACRRAEACQDGVQRGDTQEPEEVFCVPDPETVCSIQEAWDGDFKEVPLEESKGEISAEFVSLYPPGTPILTPGERISDQILAHLCRCRDVGFSLVGMADHSMKRIRVLSR